MPKSFDTIYQYSSKSDINIIHNFFYLCPSAFADLVVGAPHENNGRGAVYIYQGTKDGVSQDVTQVC